MERIIELSPLNLKVEEVFRRMGWTNPNSDRSLRYLPMVNAVRDRAFEMIKLRCVYNIVPVKITGAKEIVLDGKFTLECNSKYFEGATEAAIAVTTLGKDLEREASRLNDKGELFDSLVLDACGSAAVDESLELFRSFLMKEVAGNQQLIGYNICPGGQFIPIDTQRIIFSLLNPLSISVELNNSCLMIPVKSHSIIIPIGRSLVMANRSALLSCDLCPRKNTCTHRRQKVEISFETSFGTTEYSNFGCGSPNCDGSCENCRNVQ